MGYLINIDTAIKLSADLKKSGKKIVFTHGAFDLFHSGHSLFLNRSKRIGDILIVGLEPDSNVSKYKGHLRPIINEVERADILINHTAVDFVFLNTQLNEIKDEYYKELYKALKPKIITVGRNFFVKGIENQKAYGINIVNLFEEGNVNSATKIITKILDRYKS